MLAEFFKRREREQRRAKQEELEREAELRRAAARATSRASRPFVKRPAAASMQRSLTAEECLTRVNSALGTVHDMQPHDIRAFPLLNEVQRLMAQIREFVDLLPSAERTPWVL